MNQVCCQNGRLRSDSEDGWFRASLYTIRVGAEEEEEECFLRERPDGATAGKCLRLMGRAWGWNCREREGEREAFDLGLGGRLRVWFSSKFETLSALKKKVTRGKPLGYVAWLVSLLHR